MIYEVKLNNATSFVMYADSSPQQQQQRGRKGQPHGTMSRSQGSKAVSVGRCVQRARLWLTAYRYTLVDVAIAPFEWCRPPNFPFIHAESAFKLSFSSSAGETVAAVALVVDVACPTAAIASHLHLQWKDRCSFCNECSSSRLWLHCKSSNISTNASKGCPA